MKPRMRRTFPNLNKNQYRNIVISSTLLAITCPVQNITILSRCHKRYYSITYVLGVKVWLDGISPFSEPQSSACFGGCVETWQPDQQPTKSQGRVDRNNITALSTHYLQGSIASLKQKSPCFFRQRLTINAQGQVYNSKMNHLCKSKYLLLVVFREFINCAS